MYKTFAREYRLDYFAYICCIIILDLLALQYPHTRIVEVAIAVAWVPLVWRACKQLLDKYIGTEFFLVFATIVALLGGQEHAIMLVLLIMHIALYAELLIEHRTSQAIETLVTLIPSNVMVIHDHIEETMPLDAVHQGMQIVVKTGGYIPADGVITQGHAVINEAPLTGESMPREKQVGDSVFAGTFIEAGSVIFRVERIKKDTLFGKITTLFSQAEKNKAHITILAERLSIIITPLFLLVIAVTWFITRDATLGTTLLIFGSPLEFSLVTPLAVLSGNVAAMRNGILVKSGRALEQLAHVDTLIFDKTGTLTLGEPTVVDIAAFNSNYDAAAILKFAAIAEKRSDHIVAKAILKKAQDERIEIPQPEHYNSIVGHGVEIVYKQKRYFFGNKHFVESPEHGNSSFPSSLIPHQADEPFSTYYLATDGKVIGQIRVTDVVRSDARETIQQLKQTGIKEIILMSGDRKEVTTIVAQQLGIQKAYGEVFPEQKMQLLEELQKDGAIVAMVGDGINDVIALKQAHVGIAMGAMGMEPAIEAADIVLMTNELRKIVFARRLSQKVFSVIKQNLILGFMVLHLLGFILTVMHYVTPVDAALFHGLSDVLILLNASRLIAFSAK